MNIFQKLEGYAFSVAARKGMLMAANLLASGTAAAWLTAHAQPYLIKYGPLLERFGVHITPEVSFTAICGVLATLLHDAYNLSQQNKPVEEPKQ